MSNEVNTTASERYAGLLNFLQSHNINCSKCNPCDCGNSCTYSLEPLNGDASFRRYYRLKMSYSDYLALLQANHVHASLAEHEYTGSIIVVDAPPQTQKNREFVTINHLLHKANCLVSAIIIADVEQGYLVLEDLGNALFIDKAVGEQRMAYYLKSLVLLTKFALLPASEEQLALFKQKREYVRIHGEHASADLLPLVECFSAQDYAQRNSLPPFDEDFMRMELGIFEEWLLDKRLHLQLSEQEQNMLKQTFSFLIAKLKAQVQVPMHRDFHCRNIMCTPQQADRAIYTTLAVIDYQDMVIGPIGYDVASLVYDCYVRLDNEMRDRLIKFIADRYHDIGLLDDQAYADFPQMVKLCALQRHIKVLGIFNRLHLRDGKDGYLKDLPLVLDYVLENCDDFPEMKPFKAFLEQKVQGQL